MKEYKFINSNVAGDESIFTANDLFGYKKFNLNYTLLQIKNGVKYFVKFDLIDLLMFNEILISDFIQNISETSYEMKLPDKTRVILIVERISDCA